MKKFIVGMYAPDDLNPKMIRLTFGIPGNFLTIQTVRPSNIPEKYHPWGKKVSEIFQNSNIIPSWLIGENMSVLFPSDLHPRHRSSDYREVRLSSEIDAFSKMHIQRRVLIFEFCS